MNILLQQLFFITVAIPNLVVWNTNGRSPASNGDSNTPTIRIVVHAVSLPSSSFIQNSRSSSRGGSSSSSNSNSNTDQSVLLDVNLYTFEQFLSDFGRSYYDPIEYKQREIIFYNNLHKIVQHNQKRQLQIEQERTGIWKKSSLSSGNYWMGINEFADRQVNELHRGYDKYQSTIVRTSSSMAEQERRRRQLVHSHPNTPRTNNDDDIHLLLEEKLGITIDHINTLPIAIDWRNQGVTTPVKSQGQCGSCWAFASTAVLESHIAIQTGYLYDLSPQELVSCAKNPYHCGGSGGCTGATAEIAFTLVQQYGIVQEWQFGYQDNNAQIINCSLTTNETVLTNNTNRTYFHGSVASITDYMVLPSNNYTVLMNVVAKYGPVAVSVACLPWHFYQSGIFYSPMNSSKTSTTDLDHLVVLEGYGTDVDTGEDYWLVRNSWGPRWGEHGYIRLKRQSWNNEEEKECGYDTTPADGTACTIDPETGNQIEPLPQKICGNSGILFDSAVPIGGYLL